MKRLVPDDLVALSVGDATVDCRIALISGGEARLEPLQPAQAARLPAASAAAALVFSHGGRLVMLRGAMYRASGPEDIRFAQTTRAAAPPPGQQRRKAARLAIVLPACIRRLDAAGEPCGEERRLLTRDVSIVGFAVETRVGLGVGAVVGFELVLTDGATIAGSARVVRAADDVAGLRFEQLAPSERMRLASFLAAQQTNRAAGPAAGGAGAA
jgi:PilZ domain